jgi:hypothetical protein
LGVPWLYLLCLEIAAFAVMNLYEESIAIALARLSGFCKLRARDNVGPFHGRIPLTGGTKRGSNVA